MNRPALFIASVLLFGCGTPYQLLIHNDLARDASFTVRWKEDDRLRDDTVWVPQGRSDDVSLSYGPPPELIEVEWRDSAGGSGAIKGLRLPKDVHHAYVGERNVRFKAWDWKDRLNDNFLFLTPVWWGCGLFVALPLSLVALLRRRKRPTSGRPAR